MNPQTKQRPLRWVVNFEPLTWQRTEESDASPRFEPSLTVRRMARMTYALNNKEFDPDWDTQKCDHCGNAFRLRPGRGQWMKRRYCSEDCRNAAKQARSRIARK